MNLMIFTAGPDALSVTFLVLLGLVLLLAAARAFVGRNSGTPWIPARQYPPLLVLIAAAAWALAAPTIAGIVVALEAAGLAVAFLTREKGEARVFRRTLIAAHMIIALPAAGAALFLWKGGGALDFETFERATLLMAGERPGLLYAAMGALLLGFAAWAGALPLSGWSSAAGAAGGGAGAVISGVIATTGLYGLFRVALCLPPGSPQALAWGSVLRIVAALGIVAGALGALRTRDPSRWVRWAGTGQAGCAILGVAVGLALAAANPALSALALIAGLYHTVNTALFQTIFFYGIEARSDAPAPVEDQGPSRATPLGSGGFLLIWTAAPLVALLSVTGIPPLGGYASRWLLYQAAFIGAGETPVLPLYGLIAMAGGILTLVGGIKLMRPNAAKPQAINCQPSTVSSPRLCPRDSSRRINASRVEVSMKVSEGPAGADGDRPGRSPYRPARERAPLGRTLTAALATVTCLALGLLSAPVTRLLYGALSGAPLTWKWPEPEALFGAGDWHLAVQATGVQRGLWEPVPFFIIMAAFLIFAFWLGGAGSRRIRCAPAGSAGDSDHRQENRHGSSRTGATE